MVYSKSQQRGHVAPARGAGSRGRLPHGLVGACRRLGAARQLLAGGELSATGCGALKNHIFDDDGRVAAAVHFGPSASWAGGFAAVQMIPLLPFCALSLLCSPDLHCCVSYQDVTMAESFWLLPFIYTIIALVARDARGSSSALC